MTETDRQQTPPRRLNIADLPPEKLFALTEAMKQRDELKMNKILKESLEKFNFSSSTERMEIS